MIAMRVDALERADAVLRAYMRYCAALRAVLRDARYVIRAR